MVCVHVCCTLHSEQGSNETYYMHAQLKDKSKAQLTILWYEKAQSISQSALFCSTLIGKPHQIRCSFSKRQHESVIPNGKCATSFVCENVILYLIRINLSKTTFNVVVTRVCAWIVIEWTPWSSQFNEPRSSQFTHLSQTSKEGKTDIQSTT